MSTVTFAPASTFRLSPRRPLTLMALFGLLVLGLCVAFPGHALDLVGFVGIAGPMTSALAQIAALGVLHHGRQRLMAPLPAEWALIVGEHDEADGRIDRAGGEQVACVAALELGQVRPLGLALLLRSVRSGRALLLRVGSLG